MPLFDLPFVTPRQARSPRRAATPLRVLALALPAALWLAGCTTPVLQSSVQVPSGYAAAAACRGRARGRLVGELRRSGALRPHPPRGAREPRRPHRRRSGCRRRAPGDHQPLVPGAERRPERSRRRRQDRLRRGHTAGALPTSRAPAPASTSPGRSIFPAACAPAHARPPADALAAEDGERAVRLLVLTDVATNYFMLVGALRQLETVRAIVAAQDETLRLVTARQRAGLATPFDVERAQTDASRAHAAIPPLETVAAVSRHRIAVLIGDQAFNAASIVPCDRRAGRARPRARANRPSCSAPARPARRCRRSSTRPTRAGSRPQAEWFPRLFLGALFGRESVELNGIGLGAARFTNAAGAAGDADLQRGAHARRSTRSPRAARRKRCCATRTRSCARSRTSRTRSSRCGDERQRAEDLQIAAAVRGSGARPRAIAVRPRADRPAAAARCATRAPRRARRRQRQQHAAAARQRAALQGARRRLAGVRARHPARFRRLHTNAEIMKPARGTVVNTFRRGTARRIDRRDPVRLHRTSRRPSALRAVRTVEVRYDKTQETNRYFGSVQARYEVDQAFRVGGKVVDAQGRRRPEGARKATSSPCSTTPTTSSPCEAAQQQLVAAEAQARQAQSDRQRLEALKGDGSVSPSDEEQRAEQCANDARRRRSRREEARARAQSPRVHDAARVAGRRRHRASSSRSARSSAEGQPIVSIAKEVEPEIVVNVPEDQLAAFKSARYKATLTSAPDQTFDVVLRELSPQAAATDANVSRAPEARDAARRCRSARRATLVVDRAGQRSGRGRRSRPRRSRRTRASPRVWVVRRAGERSRSAPSTCSRRRCTGIATRRCSFPGRRRASWS